MGNSYFDFKQFSIRQDRCAMKVGTDGVLLGAWCRLASSADSVDGSHTPRLLDVGAGTGLISLMLAQRYPEAEIDAVEIDAEAAAQCQENFDASPWSNRLHIHATSLQGFQTDAQYDLIVSNPPFYNATLKPADEGRAVARHFDSLPTAEIIRFACAHLSPSGTLALIYPHQYETSLMTEFAKSGLSLTRLCDFITREGKPAKRRLIQFSRIAHPIETESLIIRGIDNIYTPQYIALTEPFYLSLK